MTVDHLEGGANASIHNFTLSEEQVVSLDSDPLYLERDLDELAIRDIAPCLPMPILRPEVTRRNAMRFCASFPGDVMYAVKCNPDPIFLKALYQGGVKRFDVASIAEIRLIKGLFPDAKCYYMHPIKTPEAIREAYMNYGVRAFVLDHAEELDKILHVTNAAPDLELYVRIAVPKGNVATDFSTKFGAKPDTAAELVRICRANAARLGISFHVGTQCTDVEVYSKAIDYTAKVIKDSGVEVESLDLGGGFPACLDPDNPPPAIETYCDVIRGALQRNELDHKEILCEAGRGLVASGGSLVVRVEGRKDDLLYINDGTYGGMFEAGGNVGLPYPVRLIRREARDYHGDLKAFRFAGPTCDSVDMMKGPFMLPADIQAGDWIRVGQLGAYGEVSRTDFNGFGAVQKVVVTDPEAEKAGLTKKRRVKTA
ncbi:MAG: type III PLP-dependent enzyme [Alphaproteobacteria bacterium]|nr:type III PLP-dependent enzyme [Alphaproteobacteria bacterium]MCD8571472.1 type III PLP-dependent enzyme [Alphaproteobacteria bacterium]